MGQGPKYTMPITAQGNLTTKSRVTVTIDDPEATFAADGTAAGQSNTTQKTTTTGNGPYLFAGALAISLSAIAIAAMLTYGNRQPQRDLNINVRGSLAATADPHKRAKPVVGEWGRCWMDGVVGGEKWHISSTGKCYAEPHGVPADPRPRP